LEERTVSSEATQLYLRFFKPIDVVYKYFAVPGDSLRDRILRSRGLTFSPGQNSWPAAGSSREWDYRWRRASVFLCPDQTTAEGKALDANSNRIDLFSEGCGQLGGGDRIDLALIVIAIGEQNNDAAFTVLQSFETAGPGGGGVANGGSQVANQPDVQSMKVFDEPIMVERQWAGQVRDGRKNNKAKPIAGAAANEVLQDL